MSDLHHIERSSVTGNLVAGYVFQICHYLIPLVTLPFLVRILNPEAFGELVFAQAAMMFLVLLMDAGVDTLGAKDLSQIQGDSRKASLIYASVTSVKLSFALVVTGLIALSVCWFDENSMGILLLATTPLLFGTALFPTWLFQGLEVYKYALVCGVAGRLLTALPLFVLVHSPEDLVLATFLQSAATLASGLLALPVIKYKLGLKLVHSVRTLAAATVQMLINAKDLVLAEFVERSMVNSSVLILGIFHGGAAVGIYAASEKLVRAMHAMLQPFLRAIFPRFCRGWASAPTQTQYLARMGLLFIIVTASMAALCIWFLAELILVGLYAGEWSQHAWMLQALSVWFVLAAANSYIGLTFLVAAERRRTYSLITLISSAGQLVVACVATLKFGVAGLIFSMGLAEFVRGILLCLAIFNARDIDRRETGEGSICVS